MLDAAMTSGTPRRIHCGSPWLIDRTATWPRIVPSAHRAPASSDMMPSRLEASLSRSFGIGRWPPRVVVVDFDDEVRATGPINRGFMWSRDILPRLGIRRRSRGRVLHSDTHAPTSEDRASASMTRMLRIESSSG